MNDRVDLLFSFHQGGKMAFEGLDFIEVFRGKQSFNFLQPQTQFAIEEDLLQEIFLKIYLNLNDFDSSLKFSSWAYAIAHNQIISNYRKLRVRPEGHQVGIDSEAARRLASGFDIAAGVDSAYLAEKVQKILDRLPAKYREVLVLKFLEEKNYQEISDIIKKPVGTVGSMLNQAKKEFKTSIEKNNIKI